MGVAVFGTVCLSQCSALGYIYWSIWRGDWVSLFLEQYACHSVAPWVTRTGPFGGAIGCRCFLEQYACHSVVPWVTRTGPFGGAIGCRCFLEQYACHSVAPWVTRTGPFGGAIWCRCFWNSMLFTV